MRESEIERHLVKQVAKRGGKAYKWVSPGNRGVPDRIILLPGGIVVFAELKAVWGKLRPEQKIQRKILTAMGFLYALIVCKDDVDVVLMELGF